MTLELLGLVATTLAVLGVLRNNRRRTDCFYFWIASNALGGLIHAYAGLWTLMLGNFIFLILAVQGLYLWRAKP